MYWLLVAGFSGVCACDLKSRGTENRIKHTNSRLVIFIRERILALTVGVVGAQHAAPLQRRRGRRGYLFSSSCSSCRTAAAATESSASKRSNRTPCVERPASRISFA